MKGLSHIISTCVTYQKLMKLAKLNAKKFGNPKLAKCLTVCHCLSFATGHSRV